MVFLSPSFFTFIVALAAFLLCWALTGLVLIFLRRAQIMDLPNHRSSHTLPTPRGGGIAVMLTILLFWGGAFIYQPKPTMVSYGVLLAALLLALISWWDDIKGGLPAWSRLLVHLAAAIAAIITLPADTIIFNFAENLLGILPPLWLDRTLAVVGLVWFMNLYNFMDGTDGMTATETSFIMTGILLLGAAVEIYTVFPAAVLGAALGFLVWNWPRAAGSKIFLGDVGSVPLGFCVGWLLILMAAQGMWPAVMILPLYYLCDATITISIRAARRQKIWEPHRDHFYQLAARFGFSHVRIMTMVAGLNLILLQLALRSQHSPISSLVIAILVVGLLLLYWRWWAKSSIGA